jgi:hypothetical protein
MLIAKVIPIIASIILLLSSCLSIVTAEPKGTYESENFKITNMSAIYQGKLLADTYDIVGMIENTQNITFVDIQLVVTLYDKNNNLIDVDRTLPTLDIRTPGTHSPFKFIVSTNGTLFDHYQVQVAGR